MTRLHRELTEHITRLRGRLVKQLVEDGRWDAAEVTATCAALRELRAWREENPEVRTLEPSPLRRWELLRQARDKREGEL